MEKEDIKEYLRSKWDYSPAGAESAASQLLTCQPVIQEAFEQLRQNGQIPELTVEGYTVQHFVEKYKFSPVAALLTLNWLLVDPEAAKQAILKGIK